MPNAVPMQMYVDKDGLHTSYDVDSKKSLSELSSLLVNALGDGCIIEKYRNYQKVATGYYNKKNDERIYFIVANITCMGGKEGQHPNDLKRIQYNIVWRDFYEEYSPKGKVLWMGLYSYNGMNIWAIFDPKTYLAKHEGKSMVSKGGHKAEYSCHVFLNDLYQGYNDGYFSKVDKNGNHISTVNFSSLKTIFEDKFEKSNPIIDTIEKINKGSMKWHEWICADRAIMYMKGLLKTTGFKQWKQNMWNGWYVEALYSEFLHNHHSEYIDYVATTDNQNVIIEYNDSGLDLAFPKEPYHFIGDLKAVCEGSGNTPLNDISKVKAALSKYKRIWFLIYLHKKKQGNTNNYEMVKWRNKYILDQGEWDYKKYPEYNEKSAPKTPHSVAFSEMIIIELNDITKDKYFSIGPQFGLNSDGKERNDKFKVNKKFLKEITDDSFVIYRFKPEPV